MKAKNRVEHAWSDQCLVEMMASDPNRGLQLIQEQRWPNIRRAVQARHPTIGPDAIEEIESDLRIVVWRRIGTFDPTQGTLDAWLIGIASRLAMGYLGRRRNGCVDPDSLDAVAMPTSAAPSRRSVARAQQLRRIVRHLPHRQRVVVEQDLADPGLRASTRELQAMVGGTSDSIYALRRRAHEAIRRHRRRFTQEET